MSLTARDQILITRLRAVVEGTLCDSGQIQRLSVTDAQTVQAPWTNVGDPEPCRILSSGGGSNYSNTMLGTVNFQTPGSRTILMRHTADVRLSDQILINGRTFSVLFVEGKSSLDIARRVTVSEVD